MTTENTSWGEGNYVATIGHGKSLTIVANGDYFTISHENPNFEKAKEALKNKDLDALMVAVKPIKAIEKAMTASGIVVVEEDQVLYKGQPLHGVLVNRILEFAQEGFDYKPLALFLENLMNNPSKTAVDELYLFLESGTMPITEDGYFLAYKKVKDNFKDIYSGKIDYSVGQVVEMPRNEVDDNRNRTCSAGLHFCSLNYLPQFGSGYGNKVVIVKINPADVVSIPSDYSNTKGRTWKMEVIGIHGKSEKESAWTTGYKDSRDYWPKEPDDYDDWTDEVPEDYKPQPIIKTPTPAWSYYKSRDAARQVANSTGRQFKDFGYASSPGYRWAVKN